MSTACLISKMERALTKNRSDFFAFKQSFLCDAELDLIQFLECFIANFDDLQTNTWLQYWTENGEEITADAWKLKYSDHIDCTNEPKTAIEERHFEEKDSLICSKIASESPIEDFSAAWQSLWVEHSTQQYTESYYNFAAVFNTYYIDINEALAANDDHEPSETSDPLKEEKITNEIAQELKQLRLLGLPTAFGRCRRRSYQDPKCADFTELIATPSTLEMPANDIDSSSSECDSVLHRIQNAQKIAKKKKNRNRLLRGMPAFMVEEQSLKRYWFQRFSLFSRFDEGIRLDREGWFSVTPEKVAAHLATRLACDIVVDGFCGCGGNAIQFAKTCQRVIAIDIDPVKLEMAKHNAQIYGVADRIDFILGDFLQLSRSSKFVADIVFLSPPWGGPKYKKRKNFDIEKDLLPVGATKLMECARMISGNVAVFLPRNANLQQMIQLAGIGNRCQIDHNYLNTRLVALTAIYGEHVLPTNLVQ